MPYLASRSNLQCSGGFDVLDLNKLSHQTMDFTPVKVLLRIPVVKLQLGKLSLQSVDSVSQRSHICSDLSSSLL